jgi:large subunit ribosomal protein L23
MILKPIITEKSMAESKKGRYTFYVDTNLTKHEIRNLIEEVFDVTVEKVRTINVKGEEKRNFQGRKKIVKPRKKAIVTLKGKDTIDLFEEKKKKKKKKSKKKTK